ncbi:suppressor protein SRP40-like [Camellia sinensis]|uniref:suppressor protein SRP40-like n=1 Tax=Camellia sinensis TaxID=4442 RepID=UPI0010365170|nr:suppressor protein SRP40-like [Camellia sinensis]
MALANSRITRTGPRYLSSPLRCFHSQGISGSSLTYASSPIGNALICTMFPESVSPSSKAYSIEEMGLDSMSLPAQPNSSGGMAAKGSTTSTSASTYASSSSSGSSFGYSSRSSSSGSGSSSFSLSIVSSWTDFEVFAPASGLVNKGSCSGSGSESQSSL